MPYSNDSIDFLQGWVKTAVLKGLKYPDTAVFSDNDNDWKFVRDGNICEVHSVVTARAGKSKENITTPFIVKISYDELNAKVIYISLGSHVVYDEQSTK